MQSYEVKKKTNYLKLYGLFCCMEVLRNSEPICLKCRTIMIAIPVALSSMRFVYRYDC
ncbi:MAG: hypothetical protein ISS82_05535 [Nanoarchaeota archaeon]|nr:hypothetical protein [Nanoarchaeota archaeon]